MASQHTNVSQAATVYKAYCNLAWDTKLIPFLCQSLPHIKCINDKMIDTCIKIHM